MSSWSICNAAYIYKAAIGLYITTVVHEHLIGVATYYILFQLYIDGPESIV